jgi:magnesium transporter
MFRVLDAAGPKQGSISEGAHLAAPPPEGVARWIDLEAQDAAQLAILAERFSLHPLSIEDCLHFGQRPKIESYSNYLFLVTHGFNLNGDHCEELETHELHSFFFENCLITVHADKMPALEEVWERVKEDPALLHRGIDFVGYMIADAIVDTFFPLLDRISEEIDDIEDAVLQRPTDAQLSDIFRLKRLLVTLRKVLSPQRDVFALLSKRTDERIGERTSLYFRDVYDHLLRIYETVEGARDLLGNALDAYLWAASQRTNEIMKRLTILSAIFLPLTFITGFFGQNFDALPIANNWIYYGMLASCFLVPAGMAFFFLRSKWF